MKDLTPERVTRLLAMITFFADGRAVPFTEAAAHFGISENQLIDDINTLWVSGAPGYGHAELLDFEASALEEGLIRLRENQNMDRPLRLAPGEAITLLVALESLIARLGDHEVLLSAQGKLREAAGAAATAADAVHIRRTPAQTLDFRARVQESIDRGTQVHLRYVSGTDNVTERTIDPVSLSAVGEHWVLAAWCHRAQAERHFRLDRILDLQELDAVVTDSARDLRVSLLEGTDFDRQVVLRLGPQARWVTEQIPVESVTEHEDSFTVVIASADEQWLVQLCLRLGDAVLEISPATIAAQVTDLAERALRLYAGVG